MPTWGAAIPTPSCFGDFTVESILAISIRRSFDFSSAGVRSALGVRRTRLSSGSTVTYITESDSRMMVRSSGVKAFGRLTARNTAATIRIGKRYRLICLIVMLIGTGILRGPECRQP